MTLEPAHYVIYFLGWLCCTGILMALEAPPNGRWWKTLFVSALMSVGWPVFAFIFLLGLVAG